MDLSTVHIKDIDVQLSVLAQNNMGVKRFAATGIIFAYRLDGTLCVLTGKRTFWGRNDQGLSKRNSFPGCFEPFGGGCDPKDSSILATLVREIHEETGFVAEAASHNVFRLKFERNGATMVKYVFIITVKGNPTSGRTWCDADNAPSGSDTVSIDLATDEHDDSCWFSEKQVGGSVPFDQEGLESSTEAGLQGRHQMRKDDIAVFKRFFSLAKSGDIQIDYNLPPLGQDV